MEAGADAAVGTTGVFLEGVGGELDTYAGSVRDDEEAFLAAHGGLDDLGLGRAIFAARVLLNGEVGDAGGDLQAGGGAHGAERVVRNDANVISLGQGGDLLGAGDPTGEADVGTDVLHR